MIAECLSYYNKLFYIDQGLARALDDLKSNFSKLKAKIFRKKKSSETAIESINEIMILINTLLITYPAKDNVVLVGFSAFIALVWGKNFVATTEHKRFMSVVRYVLAVFKANATGPRERILFGTTKMINYHLVLNFSSFVLGYTIYSMVNLYDYTFNNNLTLVSPLLIPFIDATTFGGYCITTAFNVFLGNMSLTVCISVSSLFFALVDSYDGLVSLVEHDFGEFDGMCENNENSMACDAKMRNILMQLMDLARLSQCMNDMYATVATLQIGASALVVTLSLIAILAIDYMNCIGSLLAFYTEMLVYCYIGQLLDNTNLRVARIICNAKWYTWDVKYQRDVIIALYLSQKLKPILLANVIPLNFATSLLITNKVYTAFMCMLEMFD